MSPPIAFLSALHTCQLLSAAGCTLLVYNYFLTLSQEVAYIWSSPWSVVKGLFLYNRYMSLVAQIAIFIVWSGILGHVSHRFCAGIGVFFPIVSVTAGEAIRILVVIRACAIMQCKRIIARVLITLYILYTIALLVVILYLLNDAGLSTLPFPYLTDTGICFAPMGPNSWAFWPVMLVLDLCVLGIICYNLVLLTRGSHTLQQSPLIRLLARDALLFYFVALFQVVFSMVSWTVYSLDPRNILGALTATPLLSVVGQALVLNLRQHQQDPHPTCELTSQMRREVSGVFTSDATELSWFPEGSDLENGLLGKGKGKMNGSQQGTSEGESQMENAGYNLDVLYSDSNSGGTEKTAGV